MHYKLSQFEAKLSPLSGQFKENLEYALQVKTQQLNALAEKIRLYDPKLKQKEGWGEVVLNGKRVALHTIKKDETFTLTDTETKLEVLCLNKEKI